MILQGGHCPPAFTIDPYWLASGSTIPPERVLDLKNSAPEIKLWAVAPGKEVTRLVGHYRPASALAFSPDGTRLASAAGDKTIKVWEVPVK